MWRKVDRNNLPDDKVFVCKNGELLTGVICYINDQEAVIFRSESSKYNEVYEPSYYVSAEELISLCPDPS